LLVRQDIGSDSLFGDSPFASVGIGLVSITVGVLNTVGQYFSWAKRAEGHRIAYIMYQKLYKFISVEMSLPRRERMSATDLLKVVREEVDRLAETSPSLPAQIITQFQNNFKKYTDVSRPEITNGLEKIYIFREQFDNEGKLIPKLKQTSLPSSSPGPAGTGLNGPIKSFMENGVKASSIRKTLDTCRKFRQFTI
jgi:hypothetical protein